VNHRETDVPLSHFGPDIPSRISLFVGIPASGFLFASWTILNPHIAGLSTLAFFLCIWYLWRTGLKTSIDIFESRLSVESAARIFEAPWSKISDVRFRVRGHVVVYLIDGSHFRLPMYSRGVQTEVLIKHTHMLDVHEQLDESIRSAWEASRSPVVEADTESIPSHVEWIRPSNRYMIIAAAAAIAAEVVVLAF
jgi:hypothetical protein